VDSHVKALRAKIGPDRVRTVHGVGYALEPGAAT
jgi:DNA-binding response OmpR family regulator